MDRSHSTYHIQFSDFFDEQAPQGARILFDAFETGEAK